MATLALFAMILPGETYPAIDIYKLAQFIVNRETGVEISIGSFQIVDANSWEQFQRERIAGAEHYDIHRLSRIHFETELLRSCKKNGTTLVIYGNGAERTTAALSERGYKAVLLTGNMQHFRECFPRGLLSPPDSAYDIVALRYVLERKINARRGERLWRSTSASRLMSADARKIRAKTQTPTVTRKPWK